MADPRSTPADAFDGLTYAGESVVDAVAVSGGTVGVTTHRVLALTPEGDGPNLQAADRPNVESIGPGSAGDATHGVRAVRYGVYALALFGGSFLVGFDSMEAVEPSTAAGAGEVVSMAMQLTNLLSLVDDVLRIAGVVALVAALGFAALYGHSRDRHLRVQVAGGDPIRVPIRRGEPARVDRLRAAVEKASNPPTG